MQEVTGAHVFQLGRLILVGGADRVDLCLECKPSLGPNFSYVSSTDNRLPRFSLCV